LVINAIRLSYFFQISIEDYFINRYGRQTPVRINGLILGFIFFFFTENTQVHFRFYYNSHSLGDFSELFGKDRYISLVLSRFFCVNSQGRRKVLNRVLLNEKSPS
jgi:hypothetical protein